MKNFFVKKNSLTHGSFCSLARSQLLTSDNQSSVSYGVRSSIAAYLNISEEQERKSKRKKKGWTVYGIPDNRNMEQEITN